MSPFNRLAGVSILAVCLLSACATSPTIQPQINSLVIARKFPYALHLLESTPEAYGPHNELLYKLDHGMVLQLAGKYEESIAAFEQAKKIYDELYTVSLTNAASTWLINDNLAPYRGEDFERITLNIVQALNFAVSGDIEEALVEARDVERQFKRLNERYSDKQMSSYKDDAFAHLLMGILYETSGASTDLDDALISYKKAFEIYLSQANDQFSPPVPQLLVENLSRLLSYMKAPLWAELRGISDPGKIISFNDAHKKSEVYLIQYAGLSPIKHQIDIPIPLPNGIIGKVAFPVYDHRSEDIPVGQFRARSNDGKLQWLPLERAEDIEAIAINCLNNRKVRVVAKAVARSGLKIAAEHFIAQSLENSRHKNSAQYFSYVSSLYNLVSEQADLRSWQTLPKEIHISRLILDPGVYEFYYNDEPLKTMELKPAETRFILHRSTR